MATCSPKKAPPCFKAVLRFLTQLTQLTQSTQLTQLVS
jgi:hypothetical protein